MKRASRSVPPADDKEPTMTDTFGPTSAKQFAIYDPDSSSWKMWPDTGLWGSIEFSETWPRTGCMFDGRAFELPTLVPRITGSGCSSSPRLPTPRATRGGSATETVNMLPTPTACEGKTGDTEVEHSRNSPGLGAVTFHFPTPRTTDANGAGRHGTGGQDLRTTVAAVFPTPSAADGSGGKHNSAGHQSSLPGTVRELTESSGVPTPPLFDVGNG